MIIAVAISSGFRQEIRGSLSAFCGDIQLTSTRSDSYSGTSPISADQTFLPAIESLDGVEKITPAVYRAGIVRSDGVIQGTIFKGIPDADSLKGLGVSIPSSLAELLSLKEGDKLSAWFVGEKLKARRFTVKEIYDGRVDVDGALPIFADLEDMQRLNGWDSLQVSALEVTLTKDYRNSAALQDMTFTIGTHCLTAATDEDDALMARSVADLYPQLFSWLDLIDFNVLFVLIIMTIVAGFNMISGLLILLFRNISTIGVLKSMGMTDRSIAKVFLKTSSRLVFKGMAIGNALALLFCLVQGATHLIKLNPENYFVSFVPVSVNLPMILLADLAAYVVIMLLLLLPSLFISSVDPARTVRSA
jgi:lipoprotein-releasing system permease protein